QLGCNYQSGQVVVGVEGEAWWSGIKGRYAESRGGLNFAESNSRNRWDADIAARAGFAIDRALIYSKVGAAWGRVDFGDDNLVGLVDHASGTLPGLLVGTGLEYAFIGNWTAKVEYNYIGYLSRNLHFETNTIPFDQTFSATKHVVKTGINYKF